MKQGLSSTEASNRLKQFGYNELLSAKPRSVWTIALEVIKEPMFVLLLSCAGLYVLLSDYGEGVFMFSSIFLMIAITLYQSQKTERAIEALKSLASPRALVIRDGEKIKIAGRDVVPGDVIILNEGDRVPADGIIISSTHLTVDESMLTGESVPVLKSELSESHNRLFSGTLVVQGYGLFEVTTTGVQTEFGKIGRALENIEADQTRLQKEMKVVIKRFFIAGVFICVLMVVMFYFTRGGFLKSLLSGLSAAMAIPPEEFPVVLTVFLALGSWRLSKKNVLARKPSAIETLGSATVLCSDKTGTITQNKMELSSIYTGKEHVEKINFDTQIKPIAVAAHFASKPNSADPMEKAISEVGEPLLFNDQEFRFIQEFHLSKEIRAMSRIYETTDRSLRVFTKGAPEDVFKLCRLSSLEAEKYHNATNEMAKRGLRVLAVASSIYETHTLPKNHGEISLNILGLIGLEDPIRPEVPIAIKECYEAGIKVIMITGDFPITAKTIATKAGLNESGLVVTGDEMNKWTDEELQKKIKEINVFARVVPEQKLRIIKALKNNNEVVAMTGDGVNDAPALKAADIGVAMGKKGTDVAREASSLVLLDDNFASIVMAIRLGRKIYDNLQKAMSYIMAIHIPIIGLALLPAFFSQVPILLMPLHIIFMELIVDPICSIAFESEQEEKSIMQRKPRSVNERFFGMKKVLGSLFNGTLLFIMVLIVFYLSVTEGHKEEEARAIAFSALIIGNIFLILSQLSKTRSFISTLTEHNSSLIILLSVALILLAIINFLPGFTVLFGMMNPGISHYVPALIGGAILLSILEILKLIKLRFI